MKLKAFALVPLAAGALVLTGCSSNDDAPTLDTKSCAASPKVAGDEKPAWTVKGVEGEASFTVTDDAGNAAPRITLTTPFKVDKTEVKTLIQGDGERVTDKSTVTVCYEGVNGTTGNVFDSAYQRGEAAQFPANGVVAGFKQALVGQQVGSTVAVVIPSADGYPTGTPDGGIKAGDTIVFGLKILAI
ncbi:FKBP-type peptidyl-prolyl cis-trans isomerase [Gordonia hydrophobica]|uniref:Peptidyl-prolyl cis-trans isomerase n=1 Tax=Gordonia hydrophobica TaxID=40516 RepID=A0ABZ2U0K0_9ACTN|nr:FKBP-type peptidyl-prolyl cis-trans isomerase [Gordonia hydrophobica]MBM7367050.1 hypothetical protein [Gordonia hydrophobica]